WVIAGVSACNIAGAQGIPLQDAQTRRSNAVSRVVLSIIGYTRWPVALPEIRLCILEPARYADDLTADLLYSGHRALRARRITFDMVQALEQCDVVYAGVMSPEQRHTLYPLLRERAVLSISE